MRPPAGGWGRRGFAAAWPILLLAAASSLGAQSGTVLEALDTGGLEAKSAALILSGQQGGELVVSVSALPLPATEEGGRGAILLQVDFDGPSLLAGVAEDAETVPVEVYAYALTPEGGVGAFLTQAFLLDLARHGEEARRQGVKFLARLEAPPGQYSVQVLARQRRTDRFSLQTQHLRVPAFGEAAKTGLLLPIFPEAAGRWLLVKASAKGAPGDSLPWSFDGTVVVPSTLPVVRSDLDSPFYLVGQALDGPWTARILDLQRNPVRDAQIQLGAPGSGAPIPLELRQMTLAATGLAPGQYFLEIAESAPPVADEKKEKKKKEGEPEPRISSVPLVILPPEAGPDLPLWSQLSRDAAPSLPAQATREKQIAIAERRVELVRWLAAYREALFQTQGLNADVEGLALTRLEQWQLSEKGARARSQGGVSQLAAAMRLGDEGAENLVPLIRFHEGRYREQHQVHHYLLATHARQMSVQLAAAYVKLSGSEGARRIAAANLVSIGGYLHEVGSAASALKAFEGALEYEKTNVAALLGIGTYQETNQGDYQGAVSTFRKLVELVPSNGEFRLRLAVNLVRIGKKREGEALLRQCLEGRVPKWVQVVAREELAALLTRIGKPAEAAEILQASISEFPDQQGLFIQLAALYDALGRPNQARETLEKLDLTAGRQEPSPRLVYWEKPTWAIDEARLFLEENARNRLPELQDTLMALVPEKGASDAGS